MQITRYHLPLIPVVTMGAGVLFLIIGILGLSHAAGAFVSVISVLGIFLLGLGIVLWGNLGK